MVSPSYMCLLSLVDNKTKIMGNIELANKIKEMTKIYLKQGKDLYEAQEKLKILLQKELGLEWYEKSGEAVNFVIENEYAHAERTSLPAFDMKQYEKDMKQGVMY